MGTYTITAAHRDSRHEGDPYFAKICNLCRGEWVEEVATLLKDYFGDERDLANMTGDEYQDAVEAHQDAKAELDGLRRTWGDDLFDRIVNSAQAVTRVRKIAGMLF